MLISGAAHMTDLGDAAEASPGAEGGAEEAAEGEAAAEAAPAGEEGEEDSGPPKPDYSKKSLEYVVTSPGQVSVTIAACVSHVLDRGSCQRLLLCRSTCTNI